MSQQSFAAVSIAGAIVWGAFFYPPPAERADAGTAPDAEPATAAASIAAPGPQASAPLGATAAATSAAREGPAPVESAELAMLAQG